MKSILNPALILLVSACITGSAIAATPAHFTLENTEVRDIRAQALKRDYQVFVALPDYPVLFVVDANYAFR